MIYGLDFVPSAVGLIVAFAAYQATLLVYRLYFHPLSKFPGPKLAAATLWYEFYYDVIKPGEYIWKIRDLHVEYGPIIRISPNGLHVIDPDFFAVYSGKVGERRDKYPWAMTQFNSPESSVATVTHEHHRQRRSAMAQSFSKANVRKAEPIIRDNIKKFRARMEQFEGTGEVVNIVNGYRALTTDIITTYAFGESNNIVEKKDFDAPFWALFAKFLQSNALTNHFPIIPYILRKLPHSVAILMGMKTLVLLEVKARGQLLSMKNNENLEVDRHTILREIFESSLPPKEKTIDRLWQEGQVFNVAGSDTIAWALSIATFHLLSNPKLLERLQKELSAVAPSGNIDSVTTTELEQLPYLTAVIKESLRLSHGVAGRLYRTSPDKPQVFRDGKLEWVIPAGTPVAMTIPLVHLNPTIFPSPNTFNPTRWLNNPHLDQYLVAFSKGPRQCVGMTLAMTELYLSFAGIFGRYGSGEGEEGERKGPTMRLWETDEDDVRVQHDFFVVTPKLDTKGVRVIFSGESKAV